MKNRKKLFGGVLITSTAAIALTLGVIAFKHGALKSAEADAYTLTLNNSNGITGSNVTTTKNIWTDSHAWEVPFDYKNCSALNEGHATILGGGTIVNKEHIRSIYNVTATFSTSGALKFRTSYDGATWGGYTTMTSTENYPLGSNPYYIEFSTDGSHSVDVTSIKFSYSCLENPTAAGTEVVENDTYQRVSWNTDLQNGDQIVIGALFPSDSTWHSLQGATVSGYSYYLEAGDLTLSNSNTIANVTSANDVWTVYSGTTTGTWKLKNGNNYLKGAVSGNYNNIYLTSTYDATECDWTFDFNSNSNVGLSCNGVYLGIKLYNSVYEFSGYKSASNSSYIKYIFKKVAGETHTEFETPVDENGFTATDSHKNDYTTNSIFDSANGLSVTVNYSDGSSKLIDTGYTYTVKDPNGNLVDTSKKFTMTGEHTLTVNYGSFLPSISKFNVGEYIYLTGIDARMTNTAFTTADTLSSTIGSILAVDMIYNSTSANKTVYYSSLSANGLQLELIDPNGTTKSLSTPFGVAGTWTVKVSSTSNSAIFDEVPLTVSAIPVVNISLNPNSVTLHPGETAQLTVSFDPDNATNQGIIWTSSNNSVATVSASGLVTAVKVDANAVTITATSADGGKTATCSVTVKKSPAVNATIECNANGTENNAVSLTTGSFNTNNITLNSVSTSGSVYYGPDKSIRLGKGSGTGSVTFTFDEAVVTAVSINAAPWSGDSSTVKVSTSANTTGETISLTNSSASDYSTTAFATDTEGSTSLTIETTTSSKGRAYLYSVSLTLGVFEPIYLESFTLSDRSVNVGEAIQLEPTFVPSDANQIDLTWESNKTNIATVSSEGIVTGVAKGTATITATGKNASNEDIQASCTVTVNTVAVTGISFSSNSASMNIGGTLTLTPNVAPSNATNKKVTWTSSKTNIATVDANSGLISAIAEGTTRITATTQDGGFTAYCDVTVSSVALDEWTLLFYVCGSNLESASGNNGGAARDDLQECLSVRSQQPSTVNIAVETGGASSWKMSNVKANELGRWEIGNISGCTNTSMKKIASVENASMGESSTLQSFLEWGIQAYPAKKYGLFLWNHGGAMDGCCFDENYDDDGLYTNEVDSAVTAARSTCGVSSNLEFIAYDACLMAVQDIAEFNSHNFNYMISSQETEWSGGYDYDAWLPTLYANPATVSTTTVLTKVGETFMDYYDGLSDYEYHNQTQSVYDLSKMTAYKDAWESMTQSLTSIVNSSSKWNTFAGYINQALKYGYSDEASDYNNGYSCDVFDIKTAIAALRNSGNYSSLSSKFDDILDALDDVVVYNRYGEHTSVNGSCGMNLFCPISGYNQKTGATFQLQGGGSAYFDANYSAERTNFTKWQSFVAKYGNWAA